MSLNRRWAAPKLPRLSFNHLAVSGCTLPVPRSDELGRWRAGGQPRHTHRGLPMMVAIRQTPSAGRRFRVTRRPRVLAGSLLAERDHERAVGVAVGARPSSTTGAGRRTGCERIARPFWSAPSRSVTSRPWSPLRLPHCLRWPKRGTEFPDAITRGGAGLEGCGAAPSAGAMAIFVLRNSPTASQPSPSVAVARTR